MLFFSELKIEAIIIIIKGFKTSIGWNLGKNKKSTQRLDPLTSTPIIGTKAKKTKQIKNNTVDTLYKFFSFNTEKNIIEEFKSYAKNINLQIWNPSNTLQNCNLINCSPIGLSIQINNTILSQLTAKRYESIIDINYNIQKDYFNFNSNQKVDGKSMFIYQALKSLDIWFESNISNKLDYKYLEQLLC